MCLALASCALYPTALAVVNTGRKGPSGQGTTHTDALNNCCHDPVLQYFSSNDACEYFEYKYDSAGHDAPGTPYYGCYSPGDYLWVQDDVDFTKCLIGQFSNSKNPQGFCISSKDASSCSPGSSKIKNIQSGLFNMVQAGLGDNQTVGLNVAADHMLGQKTRSSYSGHPSWAQREPDGSGVDGNVRLGDWASNHLVTIGFGGEDGC